MGVPTSGRPHFGNTENRRPATEWPEREAPFYKVATIHIPRLAFDMQERNAFCEKLSFNLRHALPGQRSLGITNRLRKVILPDQPNNVGPSDVA